MPLSQDLEHTPRSRADALPDDFDTGFVQAMLFTRCIGEPSSRDVAEAVRALQEYRRIALGHERGTPGFLKRRLS